MIHLNPLPLPDPQAKEIRDWLNLPAARLFRDTVAQMAMASSANGANAALDSEKQEIAEALENADIEFAKARTLNNLLVLIANMQAPDFKFEHFEIGPKPTTTPITEKE